MTHEILAVLPHSISKRDVVFLKDSFNNQYIVEIMRVNKLLGIKDPFFDDNLCLIVSSKIIGSFIDELEEDNSLILKELLKLQQLFKRRGHNQGRFTIEIETQKREGISKEGLVVFDLSNLEKHNFKRALCKLPETLKKVIPNNKPAELTLLKFDKELDFWFTVK